MSDQAKPTYIIEIEFEIHCRISKDYLIYTLLHLLFHPEKGRVDMTTLIEAQESLSIDVNLKKSNDLMSGIIFITMVSDSSNVASLAASIQDVHEIKDCKAKFSLIQLKAISEQEKPFIQVENPVKKILASEHSERKDPMFTSPIQHIIGYANRIRTRFSKFQSIHLSDYPIVITLVLLAAIPFLTIQRDFTYANNIAIYAFYFLIIGIVWKAGEAAKEKLKQKRMIGVDGST